jgi:anionic cell wall polymer biosynthesis LytR-Cps2A-Psr (LCP) family protein
MSGRHRRVEPDALAGVDIAQAWEPGPVLDVAEAPEAPVEAAPSPQPADPPAELTAVGSGEETSSHPATWVTPIASGSPPAAVIGRRDRAAERAARRAKARRRMLTIVGAALAVVLLVVGVGAALLRGGGDATTGATGTAATGSAGAAEQRTLLVQAAGPDGTAAASALVGLTPSKKSATAVLVPSGLLVDVAGSGSIPFGEALALASEAASSDALTDLLGVRVQDHWVLSTGGLAALVDKVGGVQAQVDADVVVKDAQGRDVVMARAGSQRLAGPAAAAYATYLAEGESETARLARFNEVLDAVVRAVPGTVDQVTATLTALGAGSRSDLPPAQLAALVADLRTAAGGGGVRYEVLPTNEIDTGATVGSYGLDSSKAGALLQSFFAASLQTDATGDAVRVLVENGVGTPDLIESARGKLVAKGLRFVNGGNAATLNDERSVVLVEDGSERSTQRGQRVAAALGLPASAIEVNPRGQTVADVIVILGSDFKP